MTLGEDEVLAVSTGPWVRARCIRPADADPRARVRSLLLEQQRPLFALLDAARDGRVRAMIRGSGERHRSLFEGEHAARLADHAPYLVALRPGSSLLSALLGEGWGQSWGIYFTSDAPFEQCLAAFQRLLFVMDQDGGPLYFRFYDPRVLGSVLPILTEPQTRAFFASAHTFFVERDDPRGLLELTCDRAAAYATAQGAQPMLSLTEPQRAALAAARDRAFVAQLMAHLLKHHAAAFTRHAEGRRRRRVEAGVARARRHGLLWESTITAFVSLMFEIAPDFDERPAARSILADDRIPPPYKLNALVHRLSEEDWEDAVRRADARAWGDEPAGGA